MFLLAPVGEVVAKPAAEILPSRRQVKLADSPPTGLPILRQRTDEPVSDTAEIARRRSQVNRVIHVRFLAGQPVSVGIPKPKIQIPR